MDHTDYKPTPEVLERLKQVDLVAVVGPTSVGKTTLINAAMARDPSIHLVLNNTTRTPRPGEKDGVDYLFQTRTAMDARISQGDYVQVAPSVLGELYATAPEGYATEGVAIMAILAEAMPAFRAMPFKSIRTIFVVPPDWATWEERLKAHGLSAEHRTKRLTEAQHSLEFALNDKNTTVVINNDIETATEDFLSLVQGKPLSEKLEKDQELAETIIHLLLEKLSLFIYAPSDTQKKNIITIAGRPGSGKSTTSKTTAAMLGYKHFSSGDLFRALGKEHGYDVLQTNITAEQNSEVDLRVDARLRDIGAREDDLVIDSRTAWHWIPGSYKVFLDLDLETAAKRILAGIDDVRMMSENISSDPKEYAKTLQERLDSETKRYRKLYDIDPYDMSNYDLVVDTGTHNIEQTVEEIMSAYEAWKKL